MLAALRRTRGTLVPLVSGGTLTTCIARQMKPLRSLRVAGVRSADEKAPPSSSPRPALCSALPLLQGRRSRALDPLPGRRERSPSSSRALDRQQPSSPCAPTVRFPASTTHSPERALHAAATGFATACVLLTAAIGLRAQEMPRFHRAARSSTLDASTPHITAPALIACSQPQLAASPLPPCPSFGSRGPHSWVWGQTQRRPFFLAGIWVGPATETVAIVTSAAAPSPQSAARSTPAQSPLDAMHGAAPSPQSAQS